jgi:DNA-binding HxlR family transcriptional regulator
MSGQKTKIQPEETVENMTFCTQYQQAVELIGRRWMGVILFALMAGPRRFNEIQSGIPGLSHRLLAARLRELEEQGIAVRKVITTSPIQVQYELTDAGLDLKDTVVEIAHWGKKWLSGPDLVCP